MGRKAWLRPRKKKLVKGHIRVTKKGETQVIDPFLHEYPHAPKDKKAKKQKSKKENLKPSKKARENQIQEAKKELACRLGV